MENTHDRPVENHNEYEAFEVIRGDDTEEKRRSDPAIDVSVFGHEISAELAKEEGTGAADMEAKAAEFKEKLFELIGEAVLAEVDAALNGKVPEGEQMISNVLDRAIHAGGLAIAKPPEKVRAIVGNSRLREEVKTYLAGRFEDRLKDAGQDETLISKIEKALDAFGA